MSEANEGCSFTIEDMLDGDGKADGLFCKMSRLFPDVNPSNIPYEDGYYVTHTDRVIAISIPNIYRLTRDLGGLLCWVIDMSYFDNWYEGPYFDMVPLAEELADEIKLSKLTIRKSWELRPENDPADDSFLKLRAQASDEEGRYLETVLNGARDEIALWKLEPQFSKDLENKTGTAVGELDAIRRLGRIYASSDHEYGKAPACWFIARQGEHSSMHSFMIVLIDYLEHGWAPEVFLQECGNRDYTWDVAAMRDFLDFARRVYSREIPGLHYIEHMDRKEEGTIPGRLSSRIWKPAGFGATSAHGPHITATASLFITHLWWSHSIRGIEILTDVMVVTRLAWSIAAWIFAKLHIWANARGYAKNAHRWLVGGAIGRTALRIT